MLRTAPSAQRPSVRLKHTIRRHGCRCCRARLARTWWKLRNTTSPRCPECSARRCVTLVMAGHGTCPACAHPAGQSTGDRTETAGAHHSTGTCAAPGTQSPQHPRCRVARRRSTCQRSPLPRARCSTNPSALSQRALKGGKSKHTWGQHPCTKVPAKKANTAPGWATHLAVSFRNTSDRQRLISSQEGSTFVDALLDSQLRRCWTSVIARQRAGLVAVSAEHHGLTRLCQLKGWQLHEDRRAPHQLP